MEIAENNPIGHVSSKMREEKEKYNTREIILIIVEYRRYRHRRHSFVLLRQMMMMMKSDLTFSFFTVLFDRKSKAITVGR